MPHRMSFAMTVPQFRDRTKTVTRRDGWWNRHLGISRVFPGDVITGVEKAMGLKRGERQVVLHDIVVVSARRERLGDITPEDVAREGFPGESPAWFVKKYGKPAHHMVTRIEFRHVEDDQCSSAS